MSEQKIEKKKGEQDEKRNLYGRWKRKNETLKKIRIKIGLRDVSKMGDLSFLSHFLCLCILKFAIKTHKLEKLFDYLFAFKYLRVEKSIKLYTKKLISLYFCFGHFVSDNMLQEKSRVVCNGFKLIESH